MTHEIQELLVRWQSCRQALLRAGSNQADEELARALHFADHTPIIAAVLRRLRLSPLYGKFGAETWLSGRNRAAQLGAGRTNLGFSLDETERAVQCLRVLELAVRHFGEGKDGLRMIGQTIYVGSSNKIIDHIRSAVETVFDPFFQYVDAELRAQASLITPTDIMREIQNLVDNNTSVRYQQTHQLLADAYRLLFTLSAESSTASWNQIGYSCRQTLVCFAKEVFSPIYVPEGEEQPKGDDARNKLKWTVRYHLKQAGVGDRYREAVEGIVQANWGFVSTVGHRQESVTEKDARLAVVYTYLTISLVDCVVGDSS